MRRTISIRWSARALIWLADAMPGRRIAGAEHWRLAMIKLLRQVERAVTDVAAVMVTDGLRSVRSERGASGGAALVEQLFTQRHLKTATRQASRSSKRRQTAAHHACRQKEMKNPQQIFFANSVAPGTSLLAQEALDP
jgi:hypothetical protein